MDIAIQLTDNTLIDHTDVATIQINSQSNFLEVTKITNNVAHKWCFNLNQIKSYYIGKSIDIVK